MERFFFIVVLFIMIVPALLSLAFASRHWMAILWNGFWYMILGEVSVRAFGTPDAKYLGLAFFIAYVYRALVRPKPSVRFQFQQMNQYGPHPSRPTARPTPSREPPPSEREVFEAEYKRIETDIR